MGVRERQNPLLKETFLPKQNSDRCNNQTKPLTDHASYKSIRKEGAAKKLSGRDWAKSYQKQSEVKGGKKLSHLEVGRSLNQTSLLPKTKRKAEQALAVQTNGIPKDPLKVGQTNHFQKH